MSGDVKEKGAKVLETYIGRRYLGPLRKITLLDRKNCSKHHYLILERDAKLVAECLRATIRRIARNCVNPSVHDEQR